MTETKSIPKKSVLEDIIKVRKTKRNYSKSIPTQLEITEVIKAGFFSPYASLNVADPQKLREFRVLKKGTEEREFVEKKIMNKAKFLTRFTKNRVIRFFWRLIEGYRLTAKELKMTNSFLTQNATNTGHFAHFEKAPYLIIIAERNRIPKQANYLVHQSLGHCLQNMWLMATAYDLAFQPVSIVKMLNKDKKFCKMLNLKPKEYELNGCLIGYPEITKKSEKSLEFDPELSIDWFI